MKRTSHYFSIIAMLLLSYTSAFAYDFEVDGIYYNIISLTDHTCEVTHGESDYAGDITIPSEVTFKDRKFNVLSIGKFAFKDCGSMTSITIPNSVTEIGTKAFYNCTSLTSISIPNSVTVIGYWAFLNCQQLSSVNISNSVKVIQDGVFQNCTSLTSITIPNSVMEIGGMAFYNCTSLTSITIPNTVIEIRHHAFAECESLISVNIPNSVKELGPGVFENCNHVKELTIGASLKDFNFFQIFGGAMKFLTLKFSDSKDAVKISSAKYYTQNLKELYVGRQIICDEYDDDKFNLEHLDTLTFGPDVNEESNALTLNNIPKTTVIYCQNLTPPSFGTEFSNANYISNVVFVPQQALEAYQKADGWKNFWDLRPYSYESGIATPKSEAINDPVKVYNLNGVLLMTVESYSELEVLPAGVYIVNGKKIIIN